MAFFDKRELQIISEEARADLSGASFNKNLSAVDFDEVDKYFYITIDRVLFSSPITTIKRVLEAHNFVANLENTLSCLDSFVFSVRASCAAGAEEDTAAAKVSEYLPCLRFELPQKNKVGPVLQSFYNEISKYNLNSDDSKKPVIEHTPKVETNKDLGEELEQMKKMVTEQEQKINALTAQLSREQKLLSRASRALDSQRLLPDNAKLCRVDSIDFKRRIVSIKADRKTLEMPTHLLNRVPQLKARCLITFDSMTGLPVGILFFDNEELGNIQRRTAKLLYVEGNSFKARDSARNIVQIKALNETEEATIATLKRGMEVLLSVADGFVVRFSEISGSESRHLKHQVEEQMLVFGLARNQLVDLSSADNTQITYIG